MIELDPGTKEEIARLMTSDNDRRLYRTENELRAFARNAGIDSVTDEVIGGRLRLARLALEGGNSEVSNAERAILRLADPREHGAKKDAYEETLRRLGEILSPESLQVVHDQRNRPAIIPLVSRKPNAPLKDIELLVSLDQVVSDPELAAVAQQRLDEARKCHEAGAYIACIIMLGSLIEGVLLDAAASRLGKLPKPAKDISLDELIKLAHGNGWIQLDAQLGSHLIRQHRNFVHPDLQRRVGAPPDADTLSLDPPENSP